MDRVLQSNWVLHGEPFGEEGCPSFLGRVDPGSAWVRTGRVGEGRTRRVGDELCAGWIVEELAPAEAPLPGFMTLRRADRRLRVAEAPTAAPRRPEGAFGLLAEPSDER